MNPHSPVPGTTDVPGPVLTGPPAGTAPGDPVLGHAVLDGAAFDGAAFDGAAFDGAAFDGAVFDGAVFDGAAAGGTAVDVGAGAVAVLMGDQDLVRREFDDLIAASWADPPPDRPGRPRRSPPRRPAPLAYRAHRSPAGMSRPRTRPRTPTVPARERGPPAYPHDE